MKRRRWPDGAEEQRRAAITMIRDTRKLIQEIRRLARIDPVLIELMSADAETNLADAERYLVLARSGEAEEPS